MTTAKAKQDSKSKQRSKALQRPTAENLDSYPKLKAQLAEIEDQPHPVDRTCFLNIILLNYIRPYLQLAKKVIVTQRCHYKLPKTEDLFRTRDEMGMYLYSNGKSARERTETRDPSLPDADAGMCFEMIPTLRASILGAFFRAYFFQFIYIMFLLLFSSFLNFLSVFAMKNGLDEVSKQFASPEARMYDKPIILFWFMIVWSISLLTAIIRGWVGVEQARIVIRLVGGMHGIMFEKFLRIGIVNPHEHDEGSIISYLQSDVMRLYSSMFGITQFITNIVNLLLCIFIGIYFFGWIFTVMLVGLFVLGYSNKLVIVGILKHYMLYTKFMDKRLNLFKNILKNIVFIKISAIENVFFEKVNRLRVDEVKHNLNLSYYDCILDLIMTFGTACIIILFLFTYFRANKSFDVSTITILLRVFDLLKNSLFGIPAGIGVLSNLAVNINRLTLFLESKELDSWKVRAKPNPNSKYGVEIRNGTFYWDKKISKEEAQAIRKEKMEAKKKNKKGGKKNKDKKQTSAKQSIVSKSDDSNLRQTLLTAKTDDSEFPGGEKAEHEDGRFVMDINFKAEKGKLTMVIGKIGSGKSSLLYSILGETMVGDYLKTSVHINGSVCFMSQNPWLIDGTVKTNILLNKPFDQEKFDWAIKYSALDHDLKNWDLKENHKIGESGAALSGGQRARVVLARCLYQE